MALLTERLREFYFKAINMLLLSEQSRRPNA